MYLDELIPEHCKGEKDIPRGKPLAETAITNYNTWRYCDFFLDWYDRKRLEFPEEKF
jgi:hypothetical protein